jgi:tetratricopeptide (TPR) repeat protein
MIQRRRSLAAILAGFLLVWEPVWAQRPAAPSYTEILELYQQHRIVEALAALATIADSKVQSGQKLIFKTLEQTVPGETPAAAGLLRAGALIHAEEAFHLADHDSAGTVRHLNVARAYVHKIASGGREPLFVRDWWLLVISVFQGQFDLVMANELGRQARDIVGESPELLLAIGVTQEMAWTKAHDDDGKSPLNGDVGDAEYAYRKALTLQPDLVEARVRLGRVLTLRGEIDESLRVLGAVGAADDAESRYLARLFEGDALERRGNFAQAEQQYLAAFAAVPRAQSARVALAHLRHLNGPRADAAATVRATTEDRTAGDDTDPWFWYTQGLLWRVPEYVHRLRAAVQR